MRLLVRAMLVQAMRLLIVGLTIGLLAGCSWMSSDKDEKKEAEDRTRNYTEKDFYDNIQRDLTARDWTKACLLYTSPSPRDGLLSRMPSSA